jgi:hypothetical protein
MWKALTFLHRTARGGLRVTVREDQQGINLICINQDQAGTRKSRIPIFSIPCLENKSKECRSAESLQLQRFTGCHLINSPGSEKGYKDGYENWTPSEAFKNIVILVVLYNIVHFNKDLRNEFPDWMCPYLTFGNYKSLHAQPLQLHGEKICIQQERCKNEDNPPSSLESSSVDSSSHIVTEQKSVIKSSNFQLGSNLNDINKTNSLNKQSLSQIRKDLESIKLESKSVRFAESEFGYELEALEGIELLERGNPRGIVKMLDLSRQGSSVASFHLGMAYESGYMVTQDVKRARRYYEKSARLGNPEAEYNLAVYYSQGRGGLAPNLAKARQLLASAASKGSEPAFAVLQRENLNKGQSSSSGDESVSGAGGGGIDLDKARGVHLYELGKSFEELGEIGAALEFYTRASQEGCGKAREARQRLNSDSGSE